MQVIESSQFRFAPGLSLSYYDSIPPVQHGLFIDGFGASGIARHVDATNAGYIKYLPFSLSYSLKDAPSALIIGAGGGNPVLFALTLGASKVMAVEPYAPVINLARETFKKWSQGIWDDPRVTTQISDGRTFCKRDDGKYDILSIPAMVSSGMSFSSGSGHGENYLFTKEAFDDYLSRLAPNGLLDISMRLDSPPRALLKLESLVFTWAKDKFPADYTNRIVFIRGLDWGVFLVKNGEFTTNEIASLKIKTRELSADFSYYPGIKDSEVNVYNVIPDELYHNFAKAFIANNERSFIEGYAFNIEPPTDDRPYFSHFLPLSTVPKLLGLSGGMKDVPFDEWGYLLSWATVLQGVVFGLLIILIPIFTSGKSFLKERGKLRMIAYFVALGMGFMLIEISVIQKLNLFISNPLYSVALVIGALMIFSGIGAGYAARYRGEAAKKGIKIGVTGILGALALHAFVFAPIMQPLLVLPEILRILVVVLFLAPLGFFMGFPFPLGLQVVSDKREKLMPWGLAINGSVSVFASVLTSILSMHFGFVFVFVLAALFYLIAWMTFPGRIRFSE
jgi:spermidine synthase